LSGEGRKVRRTVLLLNTGQRMLCQRTIPGTVPKRFARKHLLFDGATVDMKGGMSPMLLRHSGAERMTVYGLAKLSGAKLGGKDWI